jgi:hypothetical protein
MGGRSSLSGGGAWGFLLRYGAPRGTKDYYRESQPTHPTIALVS